MNTGSISMLWREHTRVIITSVLTHCGTHLLCLDGVNLCLFSVNFCQSILILDVDYVLFTKQIALEISSCGRDKFPGGEKKKRKKYWTKKQFISSYLAHDTKPNCHCNFSRIPEPSPPDRLLTSLYWLSSTAAANFSPNCVFFSFLSLINFSLFSLYLVFFFNKSKYSHHRSFSLWL